LPPTKYQDIRQQSFDAGFGKGFGKGVKECYNLGWYDAIDGLKGLADEGLRAKIDELATLVAENLRQSRQSEDQQITLIFF